MLFGAGFLLSGTREACAIIGSVMASKSDSLSVLFGGTARVKLLRFFLFNPESIFGFDDIARRARLVRRTARTELNALERAKIVVRKYTYEELAGSDRKRRIFGYTLNQKYPLLTPLQTFFFATAPINTRTIMKHLRMVGNFDFLVAAGVFVGESERRVDVLLVGKRPTPQKVEQAMRALEAELGVEIKYAYLNTDEFIYRIGMRDKLIRDVFDYPHRVLVDRIAVHDDIMRK